MLIARFAIRGNIRRSFYRHVIDENDGRCICGWYERGSVWSNIVLVVGVLNKLPTGMRHCNRVDIDRLVYVNMSVT